MKHGFQSSQKAVEKQYLKPTGDSSWEAMLEQAKKLHQRGVEGDQQAVQKTYALLKKIRGTSLNHNSMIDAYLGSTMVLLGRDEKNPEERVRKVMNGLKILDHAVSKEKNNAEIRMLRAYVCFHLPDDVFHRLSTAVGDFNWLLKAYKNNPSLYAASTYRQLYQDLRTAESMGGN